MYQCLCLFVDACVRLFVYMDTIFMYIHYRHSTETSTVYVWKCFSMCVRTVMVLRGG